MANENKARTVDEQIQTDLEALETELCRRDSSDAKLEFLYRKITILEKYL